MAVRAVKALLQRVTRASVAVDGQIVGQIGPGLLILLCAMPEDTAAEADKLATKITKGGSGAWGAIPMPANPQVNDADAKKLAGWVLAL
jgi:cytochrome c551/c552